MAIPEFKDDLKIISKLGDYPGADDGLTNEGFKSKFDEAPLLIQKFLNEKLIPVLNSILGKDNSLYLLKTGGKMAGGINMNGHKLKGLIAPTESTEAATMGYVDGKWKNATVLLFASNWSSNLQQISLANVTADPTTTDVFASPETSDENYAAYNENGVRLYSQLNGAVVFKCESVPDIDLTVNVAVRM